MSEQQNQEQEKSVVAKGPGDVLQAARIEQGISIEDIARQMNLNARILQSIEDDDYSEIQSPIFIRGYLRTYSRLVSVNDDEMIKLFGEFYKADDPDIKAIGNTVPEISSNDFRVKWMTYTVIIGLVVLLSVWWVNNYKTADILDETNSEEPASTIIDSSNDSTSMEKLKPIELVIVVDPNLMAEKEMQEVVASNDTVSEPESTLESVMPTVEEIANDVNNETQVTEVQVKEELEQEQENVLMNSDVQINIETQAIQVAQKKTYTKESTAPNGKDVLEINVIASSWGEIKDASKFKLLQDLMNGGSTYRLVGKAPFNIFLGNGYGVELTLNGNSVDFSQHVKSSNNTARFELEL